MVPVAWMIFCEAAHICPVFPTEFYFCQPFVIYGIGWLSSTGLDN